MRQLILLFAATALMTICPVAGSAATAGLALMKIEQGARPVGMGSAFVSVTDDANATLYNPAAAITFDEFRVSVTHTEHWENIRLEALHFGARLSNRSTFHGGIRYAAIGDLEGRSEVPSDDPLYEFDSHDISIKSGFAFQATNRLALGIAAGWFIEEIEGFRGSAFNVDLGAVAQITEATAIGASAVNLGSDFGLTKAGQRGSRDIEIPSVYRAGISHRYRAYLGALDIVYLDDDVHAHVGAEAQVHDLFQVRAGYMFNYDTKNIAAGASFTKRNISVDYAFIPYTDNLGTSHQFSLSVKL